MADTNPSSDNPIDQRKLIEQKRAEWDAITQKRIEMLQAGKEKDKERKEEAKAQTAREAVAFHEEVQAEKQRADEREEWRQEQHAKRQEEQEKRKQSDIQAKLDEDNRKKRLEAEKQRKEYLSNLHKTAVAHHIRDKRQEAEDFAAEEQKNATVNADRAIHLLDEDTERALHNLEAEKTRKINKARVEADRRKKEIEQKAQVLREEAERQRKESDEKARHTQNRVEANDLLSKSRIQAEQQKMHADNERRQALLVLDESLQGELFTIEQEMKHLKDEILKGAQNKTLFIRKHEDTKKRESERRKQSFEKWLREE